MSLEVLATTALMLGTFHTIVGVDHYLPFIVLGKSRNWSMKKIMGVTLVCGIGHVLSSVLIGMVGLLLGMAVAPLEAIEGIRGDIASWGLVVFGLVYGMWGLYHGYKNSSQTHAHLHVYNHELDHIHEQIAPGPNEPVIYHTNMQPSHEHHEHNEHMLPHEQDHDHLHEHVHEHSHLEDHAHIHARKELTFWSIFIVFVLGPCEPLIPFVMYEAISFNWVGIAWVTFVFSAATIGIMMIFVFLASKGLIHLKVKALERYIHAIAGYIIAGSGLAIILFGF